MLGYPNLWKAPTRKMLINHLLSGIIILQPNQKKTDFDHPTKCRSSHQVLSHPNLVLSIVGFEHQFFRVQASRILVWMFLNVNLGFEHQETAI